MEVIPEEPVNPGADVGALEQKAKCDIVFLDPDDLYAIATSLILFAIMISALIGPFAYEIFTMANLITSSSKAQLEQPVMHSVLNLIVFIFYFIGIVFVFFVACLIWIASRSSYRRINRSNGLILCAMRFFLEIMDLERQDIIMIVLACVALVGVAVIGIACKCRKTHSSQFGDQTILPYGAAMVCWVFAWVVILVVTSISFYA